MFKNKRCRFSLSFHFCLSEFLIQGVTFQLSGKNFLWIGFKYIICCQLCYWGLDYDFSHRMFPLSIHSGSSRMCIWVDRVMVSNTMCGRVFVAEGWTVEFLYAVKVIKLGALVLPLFLFFLFLSGGGQV